LRGGELPVPRTSFFSSRASPSERNDAAQFKTWQNLYAQFCGTTDSRLLVRMSFPAEIGTERVGLVAHAGPTGMIALSKSSARNIAKADSDDYCLMVNLNAPAKHVQHRKQLLILGDGAVLLYYAAEGATNASKGNAVSWVNIIVARAAIRRAFGEVENLPPQNDMTSEALRYLIGYVGVLRHTDISSSGLMTHATETLIDLIGLAVGLKGQAPETSDIRGRRLARLQSILNAIKGDFDDPDISARKVAKRLGLSVRYVDDLLKRPA
jgi:hypothetical protein